MEGSPRGVRRRDSILALCAATFVGLALLTVFAIELSNTQAKSKRDVEARVHERALLATALIDSLFQSVEKSIPQDQKLYGGPTVSAQTMNDHRAKSAYLVLLDASGNVLAASTGFTSQARANLAHSGALALIRSGDPSALGNLMPYGKTKVLDLAVAFKASSGQQRILLSAFAPQQLQQLSEFLATDLQKIPGVTGAHNYVLDGNDVVLASTNPERPAGFAYRAQAQTAALSKASGDVNGHYYDQVHLTNSTWRIVLSAPNGPLFASISGLRKWIPWAIFAAFALVALIAIALGRRVLSASEAVNRANARLGQLNGELATTNSKLERRAAELARSNNELEMFASIASHDLQEPLRKVRTFNQQLTVTDGDHLSDKGRDYLQRSNAAAERMQKLIEDLLRFSRVATHGRPFARVDLAVVTHEVLDDLEAQVDSVGAVVHVGAMPTISADSLQMRQLMQNLISNALKFRRPGVAPELTIGSRDTGDTVSITVKDNGIGFEQQYSGRIFRVFERLNGRTEYPGTGIGLALCRKIAERHGGTVVAESKPGAGATFTVILPKDRAEEVVVRRQSLGDYASEEREPEHVGV
jgi:signal transduction histidine kinase